VDKKSKILPADFFNRDTLKVARDLLGKFLVRKIGRRVLSDVITEVEAYDGFDDRASHSHRGMTKRNEPMFGEAGIFYVYFTYGMHFMLNIVTGEKDYPAAVLIRGLQHVSGPARLTKKFRIDKKLNGLPVSKKSGLWVEDRGVVVSKKQIKQTPRIGVLYAGPVWAKKPYRFVFES